MEKHIVVFAGNECRPDRQEYYYSLAYDLGQLLAQEGFTVVTGGGPGLMNEVMRGARDVKGRTIGVCLAVAGRKQSEFVSKRYIFHSLGPRQKKLLNFGEHFIALPGGIGTLYEISEVLARKRKKEISRDQKLILIDPYFNEFKDLINKMKNEGFVTSDFDSFYTIVKTPLEAIESLKEAKDEI